MESARKRHTRKTDHGSRHSGNYFVPLYRKARRGIVYIRTIHNEDQQPVYDSWPYLHRGQREPKSVMGMGTGFIVNRDGLILTSDHVVRDADDIVVRLYNGKQFAGKVVWRDSGHDIALLHVEGARGLRPMPLGSSRRTQVGEIVMSVGNPLGLENSLTSGVISRKHKTVTLSGIALEDIIQTDCAINPGSSGGPLINLKGQVIGMNAFMAKNKNGLSFALGIDGIKNRIRRFLS